MDQYERHRRVWRILMGPLRWYLKRKFNLSYEELQVDGPVLLVPNHVCAWDPLLVAMSSPGKPLYYVASEHLFRLGFVTKLLEYLVEPIPRRKATTGSDTAKACLRHLRAGRSVCLFGEGEQCWDGISQQVFPATGKLARVSGATLVTFKIEGGYLSLPRWGKGIRRGRVRTHAVNVYPPEQLRSMTPQQINEAIERDIFEDAWQRQDIEPVAYRGRRKAESLEKMLYLCPACGRIGGLSTAKDWLRCACGSEWQLTETGFFQPETPFHHLADWDRWEREQLRKRDFPHGELLFSDADMVLTRVDAGHRETSLGCGALRQYEDRLVCGEQAFAMERITDMAAVLAKLLLFSYEGAYYEIRSRSGANIRKYYEFWKVR